MALKQQPEFEQESTTETTTTTKEETMTTQTQDSGVEATKAIARAATTAVGAPRPKLNVAFAQHKDMFDTATVSALSQATPRITGEQGALRKNRTTKLGTKIVIEVVSWNHRWAIGCGEQQMNDEMKQLFRCSYDNQTVDGETCSVAEYVESLKAEGYTKAKVSPYGDLWGYIVSIDGKEVPLDERELVLVQMSATSLGNFTAFCVSRGLLESRGMVVANDLIEITAEDKTNGTNAFTNMSFKAVK